MVEHRPQDPATVQLYERAAQRPQRALWLRAPCLVCGEWATEDEDGVLWLAVASAGAHRGDLVCHAACLERVAHPAVTLPPLGP